MTHDAADAAKKVGRQAEKSAAAMLLESGIGEAFDTVITGASDEGTWDRPLHPAVERRLAMTSEGMDVGHRLSEQLIRTDLDRRYIDFKRQGVQQETAMPSNRTRNALHGP